MSQITKRADAVREVFYLGLTSSELEELKQSIPQVPEPYSAIGSAFVHSIHSAISTLSLPFRYTAERWMRRHYDFTLLLERMRAGGVPGDEEARQLAHEAAQRQHQAFLESDAGADTVLAQICEDMLASVQDDLLRAAVTELLRQGVVLIWGAFEVLSREVFATYVNAHPSSLAHLMADGAAKRRFGSAQFDFETLAAHGFNIAASVGTILVSQDDLADLPGIKTVHSALFGGRAPLTSALADDRLWLLSQQRHLIVHRRAVVDQRYRDQTGSDAPVGAMLTLRPSDVSGYIDASVTAAGEILGAATASNGE